MSTPIEPLHALLEQAEVGGAELDASGRLRWLHNAPLFSAWLADDEGDTPMPREREALFAQLFGPRHAQRLREAIEALRGMEQPARTDLGVIPGSQMRAGSPARHLAVSLQPLPQTEGVGCLVLLQDVSQRQSLLQELHEMRLAHDSAMAVLRAPPDGLRLFLGSAMASVGAIRATLRVPARTQEALREKLGRLRTEALALGAEAQGLGLSPVSQACQTLVDLTTSLLARGTVSGDDLLPVAPRIDAIASAIGSASRIAEQRHEPPPPAEDPTRRTRRSAAWHDVSERRWTEFLRRHGEETGTLARLAMTGAQQVPVFHRRHVDEILQHLLRNALDHGIETPEERLAAGKSAAGRVSVGFTLGESGTLKMTVHDDGRGFDLARIGRAAVQSGLLSEDSLVKRDAGEVVGLIFKPSFTTEGLEEREGQGRGMAYLRRKITRLGGQISVATKAGRYTLFTIELPESEISDESPGAIDQAMP